MEPVITKRSGRSREAGMTLVLTIFVLLALTFAVMGLLYFVRYDSEVSANVAVQASAQEASDMGLAAANADLQALSRFPQTLNMAGATWYDTAAGAPPASSFWAGCVALKTCAVLSPVTVNGVTFTVEYVVEPTVLPPQTLNGFEQLGNESTSYLVYDAYANVSLGAPIASHLNVDVEAVLRKEG